MRFAFSQNAISRLTIGLISFVVLLNAATNFAAAHFVWVYNDSGQIKVVFGEGLEPDQAEFLEGISHMSVVGQAGSNSSVPLKFSKHSEDELGWFQIEGVDPNTTSVNVACLYGIFGRGDSSMLLDYSAKYVRLGQEARLEAAEELTLDLVPRWVDGQLQVQAFHAGQPIENAEIVAFQIESAVTEVQSDKNGVVKLQPTARWIIRAKHVVAEAGEHQGESYDEKRFYCTLVVDPASVKVGLSPQDTIDTAKTETATVSPTSLSRLDTKVTDLPVGITSFGGASIGSDLYVLGGQKGRAHSYADSYQNTQLYHLNVDAGGSWESIGQYRGLQGLGLVAYGENLYAIGGLEARNKEGEDHDLHSVADFAKFDLQTKKWSQLPSLPVGLSSFDACIVHDSVYVVGGWTMTGEDSVWSNKLYWFNFKADEPKWESAEWPYEVRALSVQTLGNKLFAIGGIDSDGGPSSSVYVYDLETKQWSEGPELPTEESMNGFGSASVVLGNHLYTSVYEGPVYQLNDDLSGWSTAYLLDEGRFFHRLLPIKDSEVAVVGGANMSVGKIQEVELLKTDVSVNESSNDPHKQN